MTARTERHTAAPTDGPDGEGRPGTPKEDPA